jgi:hypothetical protein
MAEDIGGIKNQAPDNLEYLCSFYKVRHGAWPDLVGLEEFGIRPGSMVDVATIDLKTWIVRGFEIKRSRRDFLRDDKWRGYLPFFNYFWFVAPRPGIVLPEDLPDDIGLLIKEDGKALGRLVEVKEAKRLQPVIVRHSFGEDYMVRLLARLLRSASWRKEKSFRRGAVAGASAVASAMLEVLNSKGKIDAEDLTDWQYIIGGIRDPKLDEDKEDPGNGG